MIDQDMEEAAQEIEADELGRQLVVDEVADEVAEEKEEVKGNYMANAELELYLSSDGKNTVHLKTNEPDNKTRKEAIAKAMELYDFVLARYGTKQTLNKATYNPVVTPEVKPDQATCKHVNVKFVESHTEKNPGRWFKTCKDCGAFCGWQ